MAEERIPEKLGAPKDKNKKCPWWPYVIFCLVIGMLVGVGVFESQKRHTEEVRLDQELTKVKSDLMACQATHVSKCEEVPKKVVKKVRKVRHHAIPKKPPVAQARVEEKKFDPRVCGEGTDAVINKATGKPECRAVPAAVTSVVPMPAPVVKRVIAEPKEPDVYYPAVAAIEEESSLPTARHALGCAGVGALGGLVVEGNGRGAARGALVAVVGDLIGTAIGGRTGGDIGCGVGTVGNMAYRYNRGRNNSSPPVVAVNPPNPRPSVTPPGVTVNPGLPGVTLN